MLAALGSGQSVSCGSSPPAQGLHHVRCCPRRSGIAGVAIVTAAHLLNTVPNAVRRSTDPSADAVIVLSLDSPTVLSDRPTMFRVRCISEPNPQRCLTAQIWSTCHTTGTRVVRAGRARARRRRHPRMDAVAFVSPGANFVKGQPGRPSTHATDAVQNHTW